MYNNPVLTDRTLVASFDEQESAVRALTRLHALGFNAEEAWIVERNDGVPEDTAIPRAGATVNTPKKEGFFASLERMFSMTPDAERPVRHEHLSDDSERYLNEALTTNRTLLIVVASPARLIDARDLLLAEDGVIDEQVNEFINQDVTKERTLRLHAEELVAHKETVESDEVVVRKEVVTETRTIEVPVSHEELIIERRPLSANEAVPGERISATGDEAATMRIRLMEEQVSVEKRVVPTEEILLSKREIKDTTKVSDQVRHEEARIERIAMASKNKATPEKRPPA